MKLVHAVSFAIAASLLCLSACSEARAEASATAPDTVPAADLADEPLAVYKRELLVLAYQGATEMPVAPHVKTRSRLQGRVVETLLELGQHRLAHECIGGIENWQRGLALAQLARSRAEHGASVAQVEPYLEGAQRVADGGEEALGQSWRRDRILSAIGAAYVRLGESEKAYEVERGIVEESETGKLELLRAEDADRDACDRQIAGFDAVLERGTLDLVRNVLDAALELYDRFYDDEVRSGLLETKIQAGVKQLPRMLGIDVMCELARVTFAHDHRERAVLALDEAQKLFDGAGWTPADSIKLMSRLASARAAIGDVDGARRQADEALALFGEARSEIPDMWRGEGLRELAEAYVAMGATDAALEVYRTSIEEGALNPNARPRAIDLVENCCAMALEGIEPDEELWIRLTAVRAGLQEPW